MRWLAAILVALALATAVVLGSRPLRGRDPAPPAATASEPPSSIPELAAGPVTLRAPADQPSAAEDAAASTRRETVSPPSALVAGRVEVEGGLPAGEKVVVVAHAHRDDVSRTFEAPVALDGSFELRVPPDTHSVQLELDALLLFLPEEVEVRPGTRDVVLRPNVLAAVRGRVLWPLGFDAAPGETIQVSIARDSVRADADGRFELAVKPDRPRELVARAGGTRAMETRLQLEPLRPGEVRRVDVVLEPMPWLHGLVTDESGAPLADATVEILLAFEHGSDDRPLEPQITGADGRFELGPLRRGPCEVLARAPGRRSEVRELELPADGRELLHIALAPPVVVRGRVVGPDGAPRAGAAVRRVPEPRRLSQLSMRAMENRLPARTDQEGRFTYTCDEPTFRLVASAQGFAQSLPLVVEAGTASLESEVVLTLRAACSLRVRVLDEEGQPADVGLHYLAEDGVRYGLTGKAGVVVGHDLPPGRVLIEAGLTLGRELRSAYEGSVEVVLTPELETQAELRVRRTK